MIRLYIVRHGETKLNNDTDTSQDRIRGWTDVPLTDKGRQEAKVAGEKLKKHNIEVICCSPLSRAHETAKIIGKILNIKPVTIDGLKPWNLGELTGTSTKEALPKIAEYVRKKADKKVPEGESFNDFSNRTFEGFKEAIEKADGKTLCVVTHHRDERLIRAWVKAGCPADHHIDLDFFLQKGDPPGGVVALKIDEEGLGAEGETDSADSSDDNEESVENKVEENNDGDEDNEEDKEFAQCGTCWLFNAEKERCAILGSDFKVDDDDSCNFFLKGEIPKDLKLVARVTPKNAGFVERRVRCENCKYGGDNECKLYKMLNEKFPDIFDLDEKIEPRACCNANTAR